MTQRLPGAGWVGALAALVVAAGVAVIVQALA